MKKLFCVLLSICILTACSNNTDSQTPAAVPGTEQPTQIEAETETKPEAETENAPSFSSAILFEQLNKIAKDLADPENKETLEEYIDLYGFEDRCNYYRASEFEVFYDTGIMGYNTVLVHRFSDDSWHIADLLQFSSQAITSLAADYNEPKRLRIDVDGENFHGDAMLNDFSRTLLFDENFENFEVISYGGEADVWDADLLDIRSQEHIVFKDIAFTENSAAFTFDIKDPNHPHGNGYPYPHISISKDYDRDKSDPINDHLYYTYKLYFHNFQNKLTDEQLEQFRSLSGMQDVEVEYCDDPDTFQGVLLKLSAYYKPGISFNIDLPDSEVFGQNKGINEVIFTIKTE